MLWGKQFFMIAAGAAGDAALLFNEGEVGYCAPSRGTLAYECHLSSTYSLATACRN